MHKSDVGGVRLGLRSEDEVADAYRSMADHIGDRMTGGIVQQMAAPGIETIVGVVHHPLFGPLVMFGMGGVDTELLRRQVLPHPARHRPRCRRAGPIAAGLATALRLPRLTTSRGAALEDVLQRIARLAGDFLTSPSSTSTR